jgi:hypothetical protein
MAPPFLISALDRGMWSASRPCRFNPGEEPQVTVECKVGWAPGPVRTLLKKFLVPAGNRAPAAQSVARRYAVLFILSCFMRKRTKAYIIKHNL